MTTVSAEEDPQADSMDTWENRNKDFRIRGIIQALKRTGRVTKDGLKAQIYGIDPLLMSLAVTAKMMSEPTASQRAGRQ